MSAPISSSKYSLESSRRDLHSALFCTVLKVQFKKSLKFCQIFAKFVKQSLDFGQHLPEICRNFAGICPILPELELEVRTTIKTDKVGKLEQKLEEVRVEKIVLTPD